MNTELGTLRLDILRGLIEGKKAYEVVAIVQGQDFVSSYGTGISQSIKTSVEVGKFDEALELVNSLSGFMSTSVKNLRGHIPPSFGTGLLPDEDW